MQLISDDQIQFKVKHESHIKQKIQPKEKNQETYQDDYQNYISEQSENNKKKTRQLIVDLQKPKKAKSIKNNVNIQKRKKQSIIQQINATKQTKINLYNLNKTKKKLNQQLKQQQANLQQQNLLKSEQKQQIQQEKLLLDNPIATKQPNKQELQLQIKSETKQQKVIKQQSDIRQGSDEKINNLAAMQLQKSKQKKYAKSQKLDRQKQIMKKINKNREIIQQNLKAFVNQQLDQDGELLEYRQRNEDKQKNIKKLLRRINKQKKERQQKLKNNQKLEQNQDEKNNLIMQRKNKIKQQYDKKIAQLQANRIRRQKQNEQFKLFYKNYKNSKPIYLRKSIQDQQIQQTNKKQYQEKLKMIAKKYKPLTQTQLKQHQKIYEQSLKQLQNAKKYQRKLFLNKIQQQNLQLENIWKGKQHKKIHQQKLNKIKQKQMPKLKVKRIKQYYDSIKDSVVLTSRTKEIQPSPPSSTHRQIKRYRYLQGILHGEIIQQLPLIKTQTQKRKLGNLYLQMVKSMPKKKQIKLIQSDQSFQDSEYVRTKSKPPVPRVFRENNPLYERRNFIRLSDNPTRQQMSLILDKFHTLDNNVKNEQKILRNQQIPDIQSYQNKQKKINDLLVKSIQSKLQVLGSL